MCAAALLLSFNSARLPGRGREPVERMAHWSGESGVANEPVGTYQAFVRNLVFYTRFKMLISTTKGVALDFLKSPERVLLVVRAADLPRLEAIAGVSVRPIGELQYLNAAGVRLRTMLSPIPEEDFETILLVTNR